MSDPCQDAKDLETAASAAVSDAIDILKAASRTVGALCDCPTPIGPSLQSVVDAVATTRQKLDTVEALVIGMQGGGSTSA